MKKETKTGLKVITLDDIDVNNLPELQGLRESQEKLVKDCPYVEILDNSTFEIAKKNRTALLKGRTALESQDKLIATKFSYMRKKVKDITDELISITLPFEEKQQTEVKRYESIKETERIERERIENERIESIKNKISSLESTSYEIIQKMTFKSIENDSQKLSTIKFVDFDFEEFDVIWQQSIKRIEDYYSSKIIDLNHLENQRIENENLDRIAKENQDKLDLQNKRLTEIMPYISFVSNLDLTKLTELENFDSLIEKAKKEKYEKELNDAENQRILDAAKLAKEQLEKEQKEKVFEIRKNRLSEIGFLPDNNVIKSFSNNEFDLSIDDDIFNLDVIDFENILIDAKNSIQHQKEKADKEIISKENAKKLQEEIQKANEERVKLFASDKLKLQNLIETIDYSIVEPDLENPEMEIVLDGIKEIIKETKENLLLNLKNY